MRIRLRMRMTQTMLLFTLARVLIHHFLSIYLAGINGIFMIDRGFISACACAGISAMQITIQNFPIGDTITIETQNIRLAHTLAIQYGVEAQFLWDFLNMGEHTLGWHFAPIGLGGSTFFGSMKVTTNNVAGGSFSDDLTTTTKFSYLFSTGIHYYYNAKHIAFATYKYQYYNSNYEPTANNRAMYHLIAYNSFMLGYAYKF